VKGGSEGSKDERGRGFACPRICNISGNQQSIHVDASVYTARVSPRFI